MKTKEIELFFRADELAKKAEENILSMAGESLFYYEENDTDDDTGAYINCRASPKSDEYAQHIEQIVEVVIHESRFLGYYSIDNLSAVYVKAELSFREQSREEDTAWREWDEIKNYILWIEAHDTFSNICEFAEKDIDGWPPEFDWLEKELEDKE